MNKLQESQIKIAVKVGGEVSFGHAVIEQEMVMCGSGWFSGVEVYGFSEFQNECIAYAINEGSVLFDRIEDDESIDLDSFEWAVTSISSDALQEIRRQDSRPPTGAQITTADGGIYLVGDDGRIYLGGEIRWESMGEIGQAFVMEVPNGSL
ncbi:hypothetical protein [Azonexus hydrophilus]|uniref:Integron gene cassette protein n=1 Tax=Azonexus hydrophilus TaxID=418702 RepID=A0ABZ2XLB7_9RHOO